MSTTQCITKSDITDLRNILEDFKSNLYTWIETKQENAELSDTVFQGVITSMQPAVMSLGAFTYSNENIDTVRGDSSYIQTINEIISGSS